MKFALLMAWRDFRARPSRFVLYVVAIAIGVGSLAAIESFRLQLDAAIHGQGRNLLGADLMLRSNWPFKPDQMKLIDEWPGPKVQAISYRTLLLHPETGATRLVEVEAGEAGFPFYGDLATDPAAAGKEYQQTGAALLDQTLMLQLGLRQGDHITLGGQPFVVGGALLQSPGEVPARSMMAPKVSVPYNAIDAKRLSSPGVMAKFEWYLATDDNMNEASIQQVARMARQLGLGVETVASRREQLLGTTDRIGRYLGLMGFTSLMIGCLGVAGAVHFFISSKRPLVAQLRCIGASLYHASGMFVVQLLILAWAGSTLGVIIGALAARFLPALLALFLPVPVDATIRLDAALSAWGMGVLFTALAGVVPLTRLRYISPLSSLRIDTSSRTSPLDTAGAGAILILLGSLFAFALYQLGSAKMAGMYLGGVAGVLAVLLATGMAIRWGCRRLVRPGWPYSLRLAVSGLYRPNNQTGLLVISLGLGMFLLNTVDLMEQHLLKDVATTQRERPNIALIDIQVDQREPLIEILQRYQPKRIYTEPMVTMRLAKINGVPVEQLMADTSQRRPGWALRREYRTTYRSEMKPEIEEVVAGSWISDVVSPGEVIPISLEQGIADDLLVGVGDELQYDIHGVTVDTRVANLREVDWKSMQPNFFVIFPRGVIEDAPQSILVFTQLDDVHDRSSFQREIAGAFPNVTAIDISLMMQTVGVMMGQLAAAIRAIAWITLLAGFLVLVAILRAGRMQRLKEGILMRTIGASKSMIARYQTLELLILALGAMFSGMILSWVGGGLIVQFAFKIPYQPDFSSAWIYPFVLAGITVLLGWINGIASSRLRPAEAWRAISLGS